MSHKPPIKLDEGKIRLALGDPDTPGLVLLTIILWTFGDAALGDPERDVEPMDPAEIWAGLHERFGTWLTEEGENKVNALIMALQGDLFYRDLEVFQSVCTALLDGDLGDLITAGFEDLTAAEVMWAMLEVELAREEEVTPELSLSVADYMNAVLASEQEDQEENMRVVREEYHAMLRQLQEMGVPRGALRAWDEEYAETLDSLEREDENSRALVS